MKLNQLTFTRFIAAIAIVIFHNKQNVYPFSLEAFTNVIKYFNSFVTYFFVLSGFILTINCSNEFSFKEFYINRISRIFPLYFFALILTIGLISFARTPLDKFSFDKFILSFTLLQSWFSDYVLVYNFPSWSLSCEAFFYFSFPLILKLIHKFKFTNSIIIICCLWFFSQAMIFLYTKVTHYTVLYHPLVHFSSFLIGIAGGLFFRYNRNLFTNSVSKLKIISVVSIFIIIYFILFRNIIFVNFYSNGLLAPFFMVLILLFSSNKSVIIQYFANSKLQYLGEISYGVYILQFPIFIIISGILKRIGVFSASSTFYIYLPILIFVSALTYELIEKPSKALIKSYLFKKTMN